MENATVKPTAIPVSDDKKLYGLRDDEEPREIRDYQTKIGSMTFAMVYAPPDICFVMSRLSQDVSNPSAHHEVAVTHFSPVYTHHEDVQDLP
jgi:hypothetical protein